MGESSRQNSRSLKLMELLLLFLRCLLIILLAALLAEPVWRSIKSVGLNKDWILIEKESLKETHSNFKAEIDSLINAGSEFHFFEPGFKQTDLLESLEDTTVTDTSKKLPYWSLIKLMEDKIPPGSKAFIYTSKRSNRFKGSRPATTTNILWKTYTAADSTSKWVDQSYLTSSGNVRAIVAESNPTGTIRKAVEVNLGEVNTEVQVNISKGQPLVKLNNQTLISDTSTLRIAIKSDEFPNDGRYLAAAIDAIQKYTLRKIKIVKHSSNEDLLFWLSTKRLPSSIKAGTKIFQYASGKAISKNSWIELAEGQYSIQNEKISLYKRVPFPDKAPTYPIWEDGFGKPLLDLKKTSNITHYNFYSRFNPEWSDLVWSAEFVKILMPLILPDATTTQNETLDKRNISAQQIVPDFQHKAKSLKQNAEDNESLKFPFWIVLLSVFLVERLISFRNKPAS